MNKIFGAIKAAVSAVWKFFTGEKARAALDKVVALVPQALDIVRIVAALTPQRTDDEIVVACETCSIPWVDKYLALPVEKRGLVLFDIATQLLARQFPGVATSILNAAVQLAYTAWRAEQQ